MKWEDCAIYDLKHYRVWLRSIENLQNRIRMLDDRMKACRTAEITGMPSNHGGGRTPDDMWADTIAEKENLKLGLAAERKRVELIERGLAILTDDEKTVLTDFYIDRPAQYIDGLCEKLHIERSKVYTIRKNALRKFTWTQYGIDT